MFNLIHFQSCSALYTVAQVFRNSHRRCSLKKKVFLKTLQKPQKNTSARVYFLIKLQVAPTTLLKKRFWHRCFPVNFAKFLGTPFSQNTSGQLLLGDGDFYAKSILYILKDNLYIDASVTELFLIYLFVIQTHEKGTLVQMSFLVFKSEEAGKGCLEFCFWTSVRRKLGMVSCHGCYVYGIWTSRWKEVSEPL